MPWQMALGQLGNNTNAISLISHTKIISKRNGDIHVKKKRWEYLKKHSKI